MPKIKIRNFKGLNTNYDSADIDIEFFTEYKNICTKYGYIIPEVVTIEKFKEINNLVHIQEIYLDNDKLANKLVGEGHWSRSESNYIQNINKYLLIVTKEEILLYDNDDRLAIYDYHDENPYIYDVKVINNRGKAKVTINNKDIFIIRYINRYLRYFNKSKTVIKFIIEKILPENKLNIDFGVFSKTYINNNRKIFSDYVKKNYKLEKETSFPFKGLHPYYNGVSKQSHPESFNIIYNIGNTDEGGTDYYFFEGKKYKLLSMGNNNINSFNENLNLLGLGCPSSNEVGFIKYIVNGVIYYAIIKEYLFKFVENSIFNNIKKSYLSPPLYSDIYEWDNTTLTWITNQTYYWGYKKDGSIDYKIRGDYSLTANWILFSYAIIDDFINKLNSDVYLPKVNLLFDIDAEGILLGNKLEIVTTAIYDEENEIVVNYWNKNISETLTKSVIELYWDDEDILGNKLQLLNNRINKLYFYFRLNSTADFEQFHMIDFQSQYDDNQINMYLSLNTRTGVYLTQTIGYAYQPSDYETNRCNRALIAPNSILEVNGIQMALYGQNIVYPAVGRGKILEDIYYKFNIVPDVEGDWLVNISNTLGVYNIDRRELYLLDVRNQENVLLFYLKESVPYVINKYDDIIYTPIGVIIMTNKGIILFDGKQNTLLSQNINNLVEDNYKTSNIFYDKLNQHLHFINTRWYRYDFQIQVWNEFEIPVNDLGKDIIPQKLINYNNQLLIQYNNVLYTLTYDNNGVGNLTLVKFQNVQDNVKIKINDITYDEDTPLGRIITKEFITLKDRKYKDYLEFSTNVKDKLYSLELDVDMIELDNMKLQYPLR